MEAGRHFIALIARAKECNLTLHLNESYETPQDPENLFSRIEAGEFCVEARGVSLTAARDKASIQMLEKLESLAPISNKTTVPVDTKPIEQERPASVDKSPTEMENCVVKPHDRPDFGLGKDPTMRLSELQMVRKQPYVTYRQLHGEIKGAELLFSIEAALEQFTTVGTGYTKKQAKRRASTALLQKMGYQVPETDLLDLTAPQTSSPLLQTLREEPTPVTRSMQKRDTVNQSQTTVPPTSKRNKTPEHIGPDFGLGKDPCSRLSELQMLRREKYAVYRTLEEKVVNNNYMFTIEASLNQFTATGNGRTKKEGKKRASMALLLTMGFTVPEEELLMENVPQIHQVTSERHSREEQRSVESQSPEETNPEWLQCFSSNNTGDHCSDNDSEIHQSPETTEKPTEVVTPEGPRDNAEEDVQIGILDQGSGEVKSLVDSLKDAEYPDQSLPLWSDSETSPTSEELSSADFSSYQDSSRCADYLWLDGVSKLFQSPEGSQTSELQILTFSESRWLDGLSDIFQIPVEVPGGESVEKISETLDSSSEGHQSPSETQSAREQENLDENTNSENSTEQEGQEEVLTGELCKTTEAGEILPESVETDPDTSVDSETGPKIRSLQETSQEDLSDPKPTISDGHQILKEIFNLALNSPLWAEGPEDVNQDLTTEHIDSEIPELSHTNDSVDNIYEDSCESPEEPSCPEDIFFEDYQRLDEGQDPALAKPIETKIQEGPREQEEHSKLYAVPESTETPETVPNRTVESFVIWAMVKKLLKNRPAHFRSYHDKLVELLVKAAPDHFKVPEGVHLKPKNVQKLGKAAARDLMHEYGGSLEVLLTAVGTKSVEFQEDAMKHLNIRLNAFKNRPKSGLKRFFSKWDKPYY